MKTRIRQQTAEQKKKTWVNDVQLEVPNIQILVLGNSKKSFKKLFSLFVLAKAG